MRDTSKKKCDKLEGNYSQEYKAEWAFLRRQKSIAGIINRNLYTKYIRKSKDSHCFIISMVEYNPRGISSTSKTLGCIVCILWASRSISTCIIFLPMNFISWIIDIDARRCVTRTRGSVHFFFFYKYFFIIFIFNIGYIHINIHDVFFFYTATWNRWLNAGEARRWSFSCFHFSHSTMNDQQDDELLFVLSWYSSIHLTVNHTLFFFLLLSSFSFLSYRIFFFFFSRK